MDHELMDDPNLDLSSHEQALKGLERINSVTGIGQKIWVEITATFKDGPLRILDIATGAGDLPIALAVQSKKSNRTTSISACDISEDALSYAKKKAVENKVNIHFFKLDVHQDSIPSGYDVITSNLFLHHLKDGETLQLFKKIKIARPKLILLQDLIRSYTGFVLAYLGSRIFSTSPIVHYDALQSVKAAYKVEEIIEIAKQARLNIQTVKKFWPSRYLLICKS